KKSIFFFFAKLGPSRVSERRERCRDLTASKYTDEFIQFQGRRILFGKAALQPWREPTKGIDFGVSQRIISFAGISIFFLTNSLQSFEGSHGTHSLANLSGCPEKPLLKSPVQLPSENAGGTQAQEGTEGRRKKKRRI
ncbi:hypothetical protein ANANG_G00070550, partial [Anguilla anguilla]